MIISLRTQVKLHDSSNDVDIIFTGAVLKVKEHQMIDQSIHEKEQLIVKSDIELPKEVKEAFNE